MHMPPTRQSPGSTFRRRCQRVAVAALLPHLLSVEQGFIAGSQQQWLSRNVQMGGATKAAATSLSAWNSVYFGAVPASHYGNAGNTHSSVVVKATALMAEKPYIVLNADGSTFSLVVPQRRAKHASRPRPGPPAPASTSIMTTQNNTCICGSDHDCSVGQGTVVQSDMGPDVLSWSPSKTDRTAALSRQQYELSSDEILAAFLKHDDDGYVPPPPSTEDRPPCSQASP